MEMVDMVITKKWFSGPTPRSVNNFFQHSDLGLYLDKLGLYLDKLGLHLDKLGTGYMRGKTYPYSYLIFHNCHPPGFRGGMGQACLTDREGE